MRASTLIKPLAASALAAAAVYGALRWWHHARWRWADAAEGERHPLTGEPMERLDEELAQTFPASDPLPQHHVD